MKKKKTAKPMQKTGARKGKELSATQLKKIAAGMEPKADPKPRPRPQDGPWNVPDSR